MDTDQLLEDVVNLKLRGDAWRILAKSLDSICMAYMLGHEPSVEDLAGVKVARNLLTNLGCND